MKDPIVEEIRKYRMEHTSKYGGDLHKICEDLRKFEDTLGNRIVVMQPRVLKPVASNNVPQSQR